MKLTYRFEEFSGETYLNGQGAGRMCATVHTRKAGSLTVRGLVRSLPHMLDFDPAAESGASMPLRARMDIGGRKATFAPDLFVRLTDGREFFVHFKSSQAQHAAQDQQAAIAVFRHAGKRLIYVDPDIASAAVLSLASEIHRAAWWALCPDGMRADIGTHLERHPRTSIAELDAFLRQRGWLERIELNPRDFWMPERTALPTAEGILESAIYSEVMAGHLDYRRPPLWADGELTRGDGRGRSLLKLCLDHALDGCGFETLDGPRKDRAAPQM